LRQRYKKKWVLRTLFLNNLIIFFIIRQIKRNFATEIEYTLESVPNKMKVVHTTNDLQNLLQKARNEGKSVGLIPTMGALHAGHASLVTRAAKENDVTVVSIFVNPTQFNDLNDLQKYPRTLEADCQLLECAGANIAFAPSVEEVYPEPDTRQFSFAPLDTVMEGPRRPGHFNGVAQIVSRLFDLVNPDRAYFGEKDFQQLAIIREMVHQLHLPLEIVGCPIVREADGLALSSRNALLSSSERTQALAISQTLFASLNYAEKHSLVQTKEYVEQCIAQAPGLTLEYFEIVNALSMQRISEWTETAKIQGCITVHCGSVRLIDNIAYKA